jgi:lipoprotein-releasing system ATP-binding protein
LLQVKQLTKSYRTPEGTLPILSDVTFSLSSGDSISIMGPSGSGKSTLLYILGALEFPDSGSVTLDGENPFQLDGRALANFRNRKIGFVFQDHCLLPQLSVLENVLTPTLVGPDRNGKEHTARQLLERVGLDRRIHHRPAELSGGERQRVALARALIQRPSLLLCDEPTGNLDHRSADLVASVLLELHHAHKPILVVVTHNLELATRFSIQFEMRDQQLIHR